MNSQAERKTEASGGHLCEGPGEDHISIKSSPILVIGSTVVPSVTMHEAIRSTASYSPGWDHIPAAFPQQFAGSHLHYAGPIERPIIQPTLTRTPARDRTRTALDNTHDGVEARGTFSMYKQRLHVNFFR